MEDASAIDVLDLQSSPRYLFRQPLALQCFESGKLVKRQEGERQAGENFSLFKGCWISALLIFSCAGRFELTLDLLYVAILANFAETLAEETSGAYIAKYYVYFRHIVRDTLLISGIRSWLFLLLILAPTWHIWSDLRELMNTFYNNDLLQHVLILWVMAVLVMYGNNAPLVNDNISAMRTTVGYGRAHVLWRSLSAILLCQLSPQITAAALVYPLDKLPIAYGAEFDSYADQHEDDCLPGTRTELLKSVAEWAVSPHGKCIFWLNGMAGTGKSTIARTVAKSFKEKGQLGASFFFKRGEADRDNAKRLISTIIRQLVTTHRELEPLVLKAIKDNPNIPAKSLREQFDKLLLQPLLGINPNQSTIIVIVIDALDD
ncbi:ATP-binding protein [Aspergillus tanneri]|uniref:NACHT domain-containing protein n=1 Tax=Aspergillus tanneri TaxID=1220188 RepID=A0A5M9MC32_9EURO|nr:uncharacterized protein ATNIH1004_008635 [Aspergillus tanneri]KAA8644431.1 hypothetical protein ATNIH1004_008635 [Aspergillus tanneri]